MREETIKCPNCGFEIPLTETLFNQVKEHLRAEFESRERKKLAELRAREKALEKRAHEVEKILEEKLAGEKEKFFREAKEKARAELETELKSLKEEAEERKKLLDEARKKELELLKRERRLEEEKKEIELRVERTLLAERQRIEREARERLVEEHRLRDIEKDRKIAAMLAQIEELKRKAEQGSVQAQGEALEVDLEAMLRERFPFDVIEPVARGVRGADIIQKVFTRSGRPCGAIIWESKRTKAWNSDWIGKLKDDQRSARADVAVIVTETLPREVSTFGFVDGVWVTLQRYATPLAEALRAGIVQVARTRASASGRGQKMEAIYNYLTGPEFRQKIEAIVEGFLAMKSDLDRERRAMERIWAAREKHIERVIRSTASLYGDIDGIIGAVLQPIKILELEEGSPAPADTAERKER